jgi:hypothetical protein
MDRLVASLESATNGPCVFFNHPALLGKDMSEHEGRPGGFDPRILAATDWPDDDDARARRVSQVHAALARLHADLADVLRLAGASAAQRKMLGACGALLSETRLGYARTDSGACRDLLERVADWYGTATASRFLASGYRWDWALTRPYIDPLVGFRIR